MLSSLRTRTSNAFRALGNVRLYSTPIEATSEASQTSGAPGALRPHLNIPVNANHGLYAFFRKREKDGNVTHDPFEDESGLRDVFGEWQQLPSTRQLLTWRLSLFRPSLVRRRAAKKKLQGSSHPVVCPAERAQPHFNTTGELSASFRRDGCTVKCRKEGTPGATTARLSFLVLRTLS